MIILKRDSKVFVYRVAGIAINDKKLLVHKGIHDDFWSLPGGRCEMLEISKNALIREMKEELNSEIVVKRPLYFVENFFYFEEKDFHEISIFYLIEFPPESKWILENETFEGIENFQGNEYDVYNVGIDQKLLFKWVKIDVLEDLRLYPLFLRTALKNIKPYPEHIINFDD